MASSQQVTPDAEEVLDESVHGQESLGLTRRFEPSHLSLSLPCRLVGDLGSVVCVLVGAVDDGWHDTPMRRRVASQLVGDQPPRHAALTLQQLAKKTFRSPAVPTRLDEDVDDVAVLIDGTPEILPLSLDGDEDLVQVPRVTRRPCRRFSPRAYSRPNLMHQSRTASYETVMPRWASRSCTSRKLTQTR